MHAVGAMHLDVGALEGTAEGGFDGSCVGHAVFSA
jgi:hypothetical protein